MPNLRFRLNPPFAIFASYCAFASHSASTECHYYYYYFITIIIYFINSTFLFPAEFRQLLMLAHNGNDRVKSVQPSLSFRTIIPPFR